MKINLDPIRPLAPPGGVLRKKITLKSAFLGSITTRTVLEVNVLSILISLNEVLMTLDDRDRDFKTLKYLILKNEMFHKALSLI